MVKNNISFTATDVSMVNSLVKIANLLGKSGFTMSETIADDLIKSIVVEAKRKDKKVKKLKKKIKQLKCEVGDDECESKGDVVKKVTASASTPADNARLGGIGKFYKLLDKGRQLLMQYESMLLGEEATNEKEVSKWEKLKSEMETVIKGFQSIYYSPEISPNDAESRSLFSLIVVLHDNNQTGTLDNALKGVRRILAKLSDTSSLTQPAALTEPAATANVANAPDPEMFF
ncbi:MAG: hypothetical protein ACOYO1_05035 [Bacteroidales bacterium]